MKYEKLSEKNLHEVLQVLFPDGEIIPQKRIKVSRTYVVDYEVRNLDSTFVIEFDGPTHYNKTNTQIRDSELTVYCVANKLNLVRIPYFIQLNDYSIGSLFGIDAALQHNLYDNSELLVCEYSHGFHDKQIILPSDYNSYGWDLFFKQYMNMADTDCFCMMRQIHESLIDRAHNTSYEHVFGIDYRNVITKMDFINNYPS